MKFSVISLILQVESHWCVHLHRKLIQVMLLMKIIFTPLHCPLQFCFVLLNEYVIYKPMLVHIEWISFPSFRKLKAMMCTSPLQVNSGNASEGQSISHLKRLPAFVLLTVQLARNTCIYTTPVFSFWKGMLDFHKNWESALKRCILHSLTFLNFQITKNKSIIISLVFFFYLTPLILWNKCVTIWNKGIVMKLHKIFQEPLLLTYIGHFFFFVIVGSGWIYLSGKFRTSKGKIMQKQIIYWVLIRKCKEINLIYLTIIVRKIILYIYAFPFLFETQILTLV